MNKDLKVAINTKIKLSLIKIKLSFEKECTHRHQCNQTSF